MEGLYLNLCYTLNMNDTEKAKQRAELGRTDAFYASQKDPSGKLLQEVINEGVDINAIDVKGDTALHWATWNKREACMSVLLENGALPNIQNHKGQTPLHHIVNRNGEEGAMIELISMLLDHGASSEIADHAGKTIYHHLADRSGALGFNATSAMASFMTHRCGPDGWFAEDVSGKTPLDLAESNGDARLSGFISSLQGALLDHQTASVNAKHRTRRI